jgi:hypothetical protein
MKKKTYISILSAWTFLHLILALMYSGGVNEYLSLENLYPFCEKCLSGEYEYAGINDIEVYYDYSEFVLFAGTPWLAYLLWWYNKKG